MAKKGSKKIYCTVEYTEGCEQRLTKALLDIYYGRKKNGTGAKANDKTT